MTYVERLYRFNWRDMQIHCAFVGNRVWLSAQDIAKIVGWPSEYRLGPVSQLHHTKFTTFELQFMPGVPEQLAFVTLDGATELSTRWSSRMDGHLMLAAAHKLFKLILENNDKDELCERWNAHT